MSQASRMDSNEILDLFDREQRRDVTWADAIREVTPHLIRHVPRNAAVRSGWIVYSQLTEENADAVIAEQIAFFAALGFDFEWKWYSYDAPPDLPARLLAHGFEAEELESVMVLDLAATPNLTTHPADARIRRIRDRAGLEAVVAVEDTVWETPHDWIARELGAELTQTPELLSVYAAYADETPVAAAWIRFLPDTHFASLWGGSTRVEYRRQGLYTSLLAVRAREAADRGYRFLTVDASKMSRPILEKHGFVKIATTTPYKWRIKEHTT